MKFLKIFGLTLNFLYVISIIILGVGVFFGSGELVFFDAPFELHNIAIFLLFFSSIIPIIFSNKLISETPNNKKNGRVDLEILDESLDSLSVENLKIPEFEKWKYWIIISGGIQIFASVLFIWWMRDSIDLKNLSQEAMIFLCCVFIIIITGSISFLNLKK